MSIYKSPISGGQFVNQPHIIIYVVQTSKLEKLSHLRQGVLQIYKFITGFASPQPFQGTVHNKIQ